MFNTPDFSGADKQLEVIVTKRKYRHRRSINVRINWLQPHVDGFREWLSQRNYSPATIVEVVRLLALWGDWVQATGFEIDTLAVGFAASAAVFQGSKSARAPQGAAGLFLSYLHEKNILPPELHPSLEETWPALAAFRCWMREQRGIKDSTLDTYQPILIDLLVSLGTDPEVYTAAAIRGFVLDRAKPHGRARAQSITVATRAYHRHRERIAFGPDIVFDVRTDLGDPAFRDVDVALGIADLTANRMLVVVVCCAQAFQPGDIGAARAGAGAGGVGSGSSSFAASGVQPPSPLMPRLSVEESPVLPNISNEKGLLLMG